MILDKSMSNYSKSLEFSLNYLQNIKTREELSQSSKNEKDKNPAVKYEEGEISD